jgi:hypothetical protein
VETDLEERPLQVSMLGNAAPTKSANCWWTLALVKSRIPSTRRGVFGGTEPTTRFLTASSI